MSSPKTLIGYLAPHRRRIVAGAALVSSAVAVGVARPFILRFVIDDLTTGVMTLRRLVAYALLFVLAAVIAATMALFMRRVMLALGFRVEQEIRDDLFAHLTRLDVGFYRKQRIGDIMTRMSSDMQSVRECVGQGFLQGFRTLVGFVFAFSIMFAISVPLALVMLVLLPAISLVFFFFIRAVRARYERVQEHQSRVSAFAQENFSGIRLLKGFAIEDRQARLFAGLNEEWIRRNLALSRLERPVFPLMAFLFAVGVGLLLLVGGRLELQGRLTIGELVQFVQYLFYLQWPMLALGWTINLIQKGAASWGRVRMLFDTEPRIADGDCTDEKLTRPAGDIEFRDVSLRFDDTKVLDHIDLVIPRGATMGITGPTGCGKTLLASMIPRLIEPTLGEVRIGERDIREYPVRALRGAVGMAPQEPFLFSDTLARNIAYGLGDRHEENVQWAADVAQLSADVETFPRGFETVLGERGVTLSGGQRQRAAISRAIAREPSILVLDDVFSAIDTQTESKILEQLRTIVAGRTSVVISHRVSTLREADVIVVMESGRVTQRGTHDELVAQPGYYRDLVETQRLAARLEAT